jgi:hypothetical protein
MWRACRLEKSPQSVFADVMLERFRFEIDRRWHAELPHTYLYARRHKAQVFSGLIPAEQLMQWIKDNVR